MVHNTFTILDKIVKDIFEDKSQPKKRISNNY